MAYSAVDDVRRVYPALHGIEAGFHFGNHAGAQAGKQPGKLIAFDFGD